MGGAARPLHDPGNHRSVERGSNLQAARRGGLMKPAKPAGERENTAALTTSLGTRSIQLSGWPDQCFRAGENNPNIESAQVRQSHWVFGGSVSYGTDHWNHFLSSIRNEPRGSVRVQNVLQLRG